MKTVTKIFLAVLCTAVITGLTSCAGWDPNKEQKEEEDVKITITRFLEKDPSLQKFFDQAYGYVIFPTVGKGAYIVGGGYGKGIVYEKGVSIGYATIIQASVGLQIGGQGFSEIIFFKDKYTLDYFKQGNYELSAQASAVAVTTGVAANHDYSEGVAIFTLPKVGLMAEASVGGQKFTFEQKQ